MNAQTPEGEPANAAAREDGPANAPTPEEERRAHATYRRMALVDFPEDLMLGLNLGFYRTFAVPSIARVLHGTGRMTGRPKARAKATGEVMYALIEHGFDDPTGLETVALLNRIHARLPVGDEEFVYVLAAFCVAPLRWIDAHGPRPTTSAEKAAAYGFYAGLAQRMAIKPLPHSYQELAFWMDRFEERTFAVTPEGRALLNATRGLLADRFPAPLAGLVRTASDTLLDDRLRTAFGVTAPPRALRALVAAGLRYRARRLRGRRGLLGRP
ncbi:oxygenase MpaB family protein [Streptomyces sp. NPDC048639]|uniref:oxygenase MpaB family protein n=1 Tax=Streptomyces sp. NPDC048639 TaxID=3365581 RepID=UPI0037215E4D